MGDIILTMKGIDKSFPGVHALDHVDLEVRKGEVLALMGENGAGKSTLMKVLTGIYKKDSGTITYEGKEVEFKNTREAQVEEWKRCCNCDCRAYRRKCGRFCRYDESGGTCNGCYKIPFCQSKLTSG